MGVDLTDGIAPGDLALAGCWFLLGYALYCGAYAAAGSLVSRVEDAQSAAFPIMLPLLFGYIVSFSAAGGASTLLWVLAFIPPTAVVAMPTLYAIGEAPLWTMLISMALTIVAIFLVAALAASIYERSVLHSGKKLGWKEALRRPAEIGTTPRDQDGRRHRLSWPRRRPAASTSHASPGRAGMGGRRGRSSPSRSPSRSAPAARRMPRRLRRTTVVQWP